MLTDVIDSTPTQFIDTPKFGRHLPDILTVEERSIASLPP